MTTDLLKPLVAAVQCEIHGGGTAKWWDTIAAFDVDSVAEDYAKSCQQANPNRRYRVVPVNQEAS